MVLYRYEILSIEHAASFKEVVTFDTVINSILVPKHVIVVISQISYCVLYLIIFRRYKLTLCVVLSTDTFIDRVTTSIDFYPRMMFCPDMAYLPPTNPVAPTLPVALKKSCLWDTSPTTKHHRPKS